MAKKTIYYSLIAFLTSLLILFCFPSTHDIYLNPDYASSYYFGWLNLQEFTFPFIDYYSSYGPFQGLLFGIMLIVFDNLLIGPALLYPISIIVILFLLHYIFKIHKIRTSHKILFFCLYLSIICYPDKTEFHLLPLLSYASLIFFQQKRCSKRLVLFTLTTFTILLYRHDLGILYITLNSIYFYFSERKFFNRYCIFLSSLLFIFFSILLIQGAILNYVESVFYSITTMGIKNKIDHPLLFTRGFVLAFQYLISYFLLGFFITKAIKKKLTHNELFLLGAAFLMTPYAFFLSGERHYIHSIIPLFLLTAIYTSNKYSVNHVAIPITLFVFSSFIVSYRYNNFEFYRPTANKFLSFNVKFYEYNLPKHLTEMNRRLSFSRQCTYENESVVPFDYNVFIPLFAKRVFSSKHLAIRHHNFEANRFQLETTNLWNLNKPTVIMAMNSNFDRFQYKENYKIIKSYMRDNFKILFQDSQIDVWVDSDKFERIKLCYDNL